MLPGRSMTGLFVVRLLVSGLAIALGVALVARGNDVIGVLMIALGIGRIAMFVMWRRRRAELGQRFPGRGWRRP